MFNWLTADGSFSGADGSLDWVVPDEEQARRAAATIGDVDTVLSGGRPLLSGVAASVTLELLEATRWASGDVLLRYAPRRAR